MSCPCWYNTVEQLKFPTAFWLDLTLKYYYQGEAFRMEWLREGEGERYGETNTKGGVRERETEKESAVEESDFYHWACNNWERWVQWQPHPSGIETAVYTAYQKGYRLRLSIGAGADRVI